MSVLTALTRTWLTRSFRPFRFTNVCDEHVAYAGLENLGLYVHIPFCRSICAFCPYCKTVYKQELAGQYVEALLREIDMVGAMGGTAEGAAGGAVAGFVAGAEITANEAAKARTGKPTTKIPTTSLYFGGGSPALIVDDILRIIDRLTKYFTITEGIGIELHPHDITEQTLTKLKQAGVTKISIGIQSFDDAYLDVLGRQRIDFEKMFAALSKVPFETVSMDFIFALPGQTIDSLAADIELAFSRGANHVAVYPFVDFSFSERGFSKMREAEKKALLFKLVNYCEEKGYNRDSIWTFSKDGRSKYSSMTRENFLGFGCSATTLLKDQFRINTFDVEKYIECADRRQLPTALTLKFTLRQRMVYYLFWAAYTMRVDQDSFSEFFGLPLERCYGAELWLLQKLGWVQKVGADYVMTTKGSYYYHYYEQFYTLSYIDQMWNLMRKTAFPQSLVIR